MISKLLSHYTYYHKYTITITIPAPMRAVVNGPCSAALEVSAEIPLMRTGLNSTNSFLITRLHQPAFRETEMQEPDDGLARSANESRRETGSLSWTLSDNGENHRSGWNGGQQTSSHLKPSSYPTCRSERCAVSLDSSAMLYYTGGNIICTSVGHSHHSAPPTLTFFELSYVVQNDLCFWRFHTQVHLLGRLCSG